MRELHVVTKVASFCTCLLLVKVSGFKSQGNKERERERDEGLSLKEMQQILLGLQGGT